MRKKIKRAEAIKNWAPLKHSLPNPGQNNTDWRQVTILSFWLPGSCLAKIEGHGSCLTK